MILSLESYNFLGFIMLGFVLSMLGVVLDKVTDLLDLSDTARQMSSFLQHNPRGIHQN